MQQFIETLLKFYDRLQQRKMRRVQAAFYETDDERIIADRVLNRYIPAARTANTPGV